MKVRRRKFKRFSKKQPKKIEINSFKIIIILTLIPLWIFLKKPSLKKFYKIDDDIHVNNTRINNTELHKNDFEYYCCFCAMGKSENLYSRELISYYMSIGVEKFVFIDNNLPNTEKLSDVLQDYISNGTVDILEFFGSDIGQAELCGIMYNKYKEKCEWLTFFDFDEYLVMHFQKDKNISIKEYLSNPIFDKCEAIEVNWLMYGDNDLIHYDSRPSIERFTKPDYNNPVNRFAKSIIRGNLKKQAFIPGRSHHQPNREVKACDSMGKEPEYYPDCIIPPQYEYAYLMHFNTRTAEEYSNKIMRGYPGNHFENVEDRVDLFFQHNNFSVEKLKVFEKKFNRTFPRYNDRKDL